MRVQSYLNSAEAILSLYKGEAPFALWLKQYFAQHKKYGSKDRKHIAHICYCTFRLGHAFRQHPLQTRMKLGLFFCAIEPTILLQEIEEEWNKNVSLPIAEKLRFIGEDVSLLKDIFPWQNALSTEIDAEALTLSFLQQPNLYLRIRPGKSNKVKAALQDAAIPFDEVAEDCLSLSNSAKADAVLAMDADVVVQDINSQKVVQPLASVLALDTPITVWDCCAASGGKSILLMDTFTQVKLTVSDVRKNILKNLEHRFLRAGIKNYRSFLADAATVNLSRQSFDVIICDAPCSGSGTWSRNPEQLYFFSEDKIDYYANLQKKISKNVSRYLSSNGYLLYITCSVFKKENEEVVAYLQQATKLTLKSTTYYKGYSSKGDTLFAALFSAG